MIGKAKALVMIRFALRVSLATVISILAFVAAFLIRFEFNVNTPVFDVWFSAYANNVVQLGTIAFLCFATIEGICLFKRIRRFCGTFKICISTLFVEFATYAFMLGQIQRISRSIYIISFLLMFFLLFSITAFSRIFSIKLLKFRRNHRMEELNRDDTLKKKVGYLQNLDKLPLATIKSKIEGRNIMITGAAGKYGNALVAQIAKFKVRRLILIDINANGLWRLNEYLKDINSEIKVEVYVMDIRRENEMSTIFERHRPHIIFHAAGHRKYVENPENRREFISCNLIGTKKIIELAIKNLAERFVLISNLNDEDRFAQRIRKRGADMVKLAQKKSNTQFSIYDFAFENENKDEIEYAAEKTFEMFAKKEEGTFLE